MGENSSNISKRRAEAREQGTEEYRERREELIRTAANVFGKRGFDNTSIQDIANELGTNRATVYYYVENKEELFTAVVTDAVRENVEAVERLRDTDLSPEQKVSELIHALMRSYEENYPYLYVWVQEDMARLFSDGDPSYSHLRELARRYTDAVADIIEEGIETGSFSGYGESRLVAYGIIGMLNSTHRWFKPDGPYETATVADTFARMVLTGLASPTPRS